VQEGAGLKVSIKQCKKGAGLKISKSARRVPDWIEGSKRVQEGRRIEDFEKCKKGAELKISKSARRVPD